MIQGIRIPLLSFQYIGICSIFVFLCFSTPGYADREISPMVVSSANGTSWDYTITLKDLSGPVGVKEITPDGFSYISSSLPANQIIHTGNIILFALPQGGELRFTLSSGEGKTGTIKGEITDYITGISSPHRSVFLSNGSGQVVIEEIPKDIIQDSPKNSAQSPGPGPLLIILALIGITGLIAGGKR
jgi:hypothetical protein